MLISMDDSKWLSLEEIRTFLAGAEAVEFAAQGRKEIYAWVERVLVGHEYARQGKAERGLLRRLCPICRSLPVSLAAFNIRRAPSSVFDISFSQ